MKSYTELTSEVHHPIKLWTNHVPVEPDAITQLKLLAQMPFIFNHIAVMPDVHVGIGSTVGTVIATKKVVIPAAVGVDIGCGMVAVQTSLKASDLPTSLKAMRTRIEQLVPVGFGEHNHRDLPFHNLKDGLDKIIADSPKISTMAADVFKKAFNQIGTLGGGNHFIEICLDENQNVWIMLHSGSRGIGNIIGRYFIEQAKAEMEKHQIQLPHGDLAYLEEGSLYYDEYVQAVEWAQKYAAKNREVMLESVIAAMTKYVPPFTLVNSAVNCHHNYISHETHYGEEVIITRKGAVSAQFGQLGIIPGSMGAQSFIVRGLGNSESFCSCSHGGGRVMSRTAARKQISLADHIKATEGIECRKDAEVVDESPAAYKPIGDVMRSQIDLVEIVHTLKQVLCVKG